MSSLKTLTWKTEDRLEQLKVISTEVFSNGRQGRYYGDMCMSLRTTFRATL